MAGNGTAMRHLSLANERRLAIADLRRKVRGGEVDLAVVLLDRDERLTNLPIGAVLEWPPRFGPHRARSVLRIAGRPGPGVNELTPCRGLTRRQLVRIGREVSPGLVIDEATTHPTHPED